MYFLILYFLIGFVMAAGNAQETTTCPNIRSIEIQRTFSPTDSYSQLLRILGGVLTPIEDAPYMAAILYDDKLRCGGSILSSVFIVTAAHCLLRVESLTHLTVVVGTSNYRSGGEAKSVIYSAMHPNYDEDTDDYDCAVLRVEPPFTKKPPYRELQLPYGNPIILEELLVSGWGVSRRRNNRSLLKSVNVTVLPLQICIDFYRQYGLTVPESAFCAGNLQGGKDSCKGDSGGPAVRNDSILVGIVSFGYGKCGDPGIPGGYTNVYFLTDWIYTKTHS